MQSKPPRTGINLNIELLAHQEGFAIKSYHSDRGAFASAAFKGDCDSQQQTYSFSGVGAHHQNGIAERNIQATAQYVIANMLNLAYHLATTWLSSSLAVGNQLRHMCI